MLNTDLEGNIRNPGWYFHNTGSPEVIEAMDLLVQIHGSRPYNIESVIQGEYDEPEVLPEVTMQVTGSVQNRKGKENINIVLDDDSLWFEDVPFPHFDTGQLQDYRNKTLDRFTYDETLRHIFLEEIEVSVPGKVYRTEYEQQASKVIVEDRIEQSGLQDLRTLLTRIIHH